MKLSEKTKRNTLRARDKILLWSKLGSAVRRNKAVFSFKGRQNFFMYGAHHTCIEYSLSFHATTTLHTSIRSMMHVTCSVVLACNTFLSCSICRAPSRCVAHCFCSRSFFLLAARKIVQQLWVCEKQKGEHCIVNTVLTIPRTSYLRSNEAL